MTDETRPFAEAVDRYPTASNPRQGWYVKVDGRALDFDFGKDESEIEAAEINAAHESRCQARERRAAVKALREAADSEALKDDFGHGEVITKHDVRTALRAEAAAIERGEVSP